MLNDLFVSPEELRLQKLTQLSPTTPEPVPETEPTIRVEFYDNAGRKGFTEKKRYGLVLDIAGSQERYNLNFGIRKPETLWAYKEGTKASIEEYRTLKAMYERWEIIAGEGTKDAVCTVAWQNKLAGTGRYDFGQKLYYRVGAILIPNPNFAPWVIIYADGVECVVPNTWSATPHSTSPWKKYEVRF